ncbi:glutathione S-transferase, partial [Dickeya dianthicola]|nr:glutathione S-transferase [Dickeya dianthicola]MCI4154490.1 glutathione S-transferase [Dickeya dianthicola]MCI4172171.1 glutathione S-transferase [Dickeya dianthicola]MCI4173489.1 glutathione S-transferase [Dickeya dianthicola]MCI4175789.1 glutathione S-transferase [Dickeya dianthicola]
DVVLGLSVNRWKMTPFPHPEVPAIDAWFTRLNQRPAFLRHGNNGMV